ncbi:toxin-antitoxin system YwqK family antitoxin [Yeosuana sp. MJ-SS3]|uniref:Toxin-antitoxin system YwqK family antitoxin n=1 Tax=Gilvirhabdus luticola TaxID=3079858 RepID=A0ABU3U5W8_9FLAO|nr:toxin-antitoxin system YwqK family antitoxin [Yeosuana sp. MJ-SS3]MDU8885525.1 toxin-antitoxin system YwqK family antitoxin [Yeosuana sp. MJ-SS3]
MKIKVLLFLFFIADLTFSQEINQFDEDGNRHGIWRKNFENTKVLRYEGEFFHGKEVGTFKFYQNLDGKATLTATRKFHDDSDLADVTFYSSIGKVISEGKMRGKQYVGEWKYYQKNSKQLLSLEHYNDFGKLEGRRLVYYENGQIAQKENYKDGELHGVSLWYAEDGVLIKEMLYENGELHGLSKYYSPVGDLIIEGQYKRAKKHGIWKYYENGKLVEEKNFSPEGKLKKKK